METPRISVVITTCDEGDELHRTVRSVVQNTRGLEEIIVVDDGSEDGSCEALTGDRVRVIRHQDRIGVAYSRDEGSRAARGNVLCYLDGHQRVSRGCLDCCAQLALEQGAITCPDIRDFGVLRWKLHGAQFQMCPQQGYFSARWRQWFQRRRISPVTGLRAPPYSVPRDVYRHIAWSRVLRGWGGSESSIVLKSFFMGVEILHVGGPLAHHRFQKAHNYTTPSDAIWRNQAIIARVCFDDVTWFRYWLPRVFDRHLTDEARTTLESPELQAEHAAFLCARVRTDRQFWTDLLRESPPPGI